MMINMIKYNTWSTSININRLAKGSTIQYPGGGGGLKFLSRGNYLFQPGSAVRWKFHILLHVYIMYIEQFY